MNRESWTYWLSSERLRIWNGCRDASDDVGEKHGLKSCAWCFLTRKYPFCKAEKK